MASSSYELLTLLSARLSILFIQQRHRFFVMSAFALSTFFVLWTQPLIAGPCDNQSSTQRPFELGAMVHILIPNRVDFSMDTTAYGPVVGFSVLGQILSVHFSYGTNNYNSLYLLETNYRIDTPTPFFRAFVLLGGHLLQYSVGLSATTPSYRKLGGNLGAGFLLASGDRLNLHLFMKIYIDERPAVSFGGGIVYLI